MTFLTKLSYHLKMVEGDKFTYLGHKHPTIFILTLNSDPFNIFKITNCVQVYGNSEQFLLIISNNQYCHLVPFSYNRRVKISRYQPVVDVFLLIATSAIYCHC